MLLFFASRLVLCLSISPSLLLGLAAKGLQKHKEERTLGGAQRSTQGSGGFWYNARERERERSGIPRGIEGINVTYDDHSRTLAATAGRVWTRAVQVQGHYMEDYDGAASITLSRTPRGADSDEEDGPRRTISLSTCGPRENAAAAAVSAATPTTPVSGGGATAVGAGSAGGTPASGSTLSAPRKPRGRPPGSKNKPKPPVVITRESESAMRPVVLELSAGSDVLECVSSFARHRRVGVSILSGSGAVTNVTLRHPASHSNILTLHGRFDILSIAGTFLPTSACTASSTASTTPASPSTASTVNSPFTISLSGSQGQVIGGTVAGSVVAAGPVMLLVASFATPEFHRLPPPPGEDEDSEAPTAVSEDVKPLNVVVSEASASSSMAMVYSVGGSVSCQIAPDTLPWSSHGDRGSASHFRHSHHSHHHY